MIKVMIQSKILLAKKYNLTNADLVSMLRNIFLSRKLDDIEIAMKQQSTAYFQVSGAGHEGILTALGNILKPQYDFFLPYYRDRALVLAIGVSPYEMLCQSNANQGDTASSGKQMPAHWGNKKLHIISRSSCTGTQFLHACGLAQGGQFLKEIDPSAIQHDEIIYVSAGDGAVAQGEFWEALTTATVDSLPILFLIEDNGYAISTPREIQIPGGSISNVLYHFPNLKVMSCDGNCPIESYGVGMQAVDYIREKRCPVLLHAEVTRPYSHALSDDQRTYRIQKELLEEKERDVFYSFPKFLIEAKIITEKEVNTLLGKITSELQSVKNKAIQLSWPKKSEAMTHLYSHRTDMTSSKFETRALNEGKQDISMADAINQVLKSEFLKNSLLRLFGQDVADSSDLEALEENNLPGKGGVFKVTRGVQQVALKGQVFNSPLSESNIIGRSIGMALRGLKPIVEIQFFDYIWSAFMQLKNEMAMMRYRSGGQFSCPMVIRVPVGGYLRGGSLYHSQSGESFFTHIPGIRIVFPSNAQDAAGLLRTAIRGDDPVLFLEHKHLYYQRYNRCADPGPDYMLPFGKAKIIKKGGDATIISWGALVQKSLKAIKKIEGECRKTIELIDLRTLAPFDMAAIKNSLQKTNRILICHEEVKTSGFAGEITARINEECFELLDAPVLRVASKDTHVAYCPALEEEILPQEKDVYLTLKTLLAY